MKLANHFLEAENLKKISTPNMGGFFSDGLPDTILIHYTSGPSLDVSIEYFLTPRYNVSTHLVIGKGGELVQLVPFNRIAFHAGRSEHLERKDLDNHAIGIELDNEGLLQADGSLVSTWFGKKVDNTNVVKIEEEDSEISYWHKYTDLQLKKLEDVCKILKQTYNIKYFLGHSEVSRKRADDPGPAFPLNEIRRNIGLSN